MPLSGNYIPGIFAMLLLCLVPAQAATINVRNPPFNATGNGTTDDSAALNTALAQGCGGSVYFPAGTYLIAAPLNAMACSITIYGDGSSSSVVKLGGPGSSVYSPVFSFSGTGNNITVHDIGLQGQRIRAVGMQFLSLSTANVYNVVIQNFGNTPGYSLGNHTEDDGIYAAGVDTLTVSNSIITGNERSGVEMIPVHTATISGNIISGNGYYAGVGEWLSGTDGPLNIQFLNNIARNNGSGGFDVETMTGLTTVYGKIHGNDIEDCGFDMWTFGIGAVIGNNAYGEMSNNIVHNFNQIGPKFSGYGTAVIGTPMGAIIVTNNYVSNSGDYGVLINGTGGSATITGNWTSFAPTAGLNANNFSDGTINNNYSFSNSGPAFQITCPTCTTTPNFSSAPSDTTPPSVPTGLHTAGISRDQINLSWNDSTDNIGVMGYYVYRNNVKIAQTAGTQYPDTGLSSGRPYVYTVAAFDGSGNISAQTSGVPATTLGPSVIQSPTNLLITIL